jgi:hypothetical protein
MSTAIRPTYRRTESKFKGGAMERYITYELAQRTRGGGSALYPRVKRLYIAGQVTDWSVGEFQKKSGRQVHGMRIEYTRSRQRHRRQGFKAGRGKTRYDVAPTSVPAADQRFVQVVELPAGARDIQFHAAADDLPARYRHALQAVR